MMKCDCLRNQRKLAMRDWTWFDLHVSEENIQTGMNAATSQGDGVCTVLRCCGIHEGICACPGTPEKGVNTAASGVAVIVNCGYGVRTPVLL